ncbi:hybrid sensor histidine kinase/response regulator [Plectonema radiosum NIES-515]|uniref:histidine kinase n=1 Tax=Plectonema radiosum NIES-515 TaxID=2986073 RepID=A0ABT3B3R9_9CYAN|nr:hybrid sensor histidine kinase/response regulator [Plectonema radiosum]MCV3215989.1 hybrid sensor histidine kinase/response regulator [Plectonema radiosum NIES-515]
MSVVESLKIDRILAVDDTPDNLILVETILESEGFEMDLVADGLSALQQITESPPDLILLDVMMPGIDGYEVTRRIRSNTQLPYIPILLITAFTESSVVEGLDAGADDFIRKPFDTDELLARVRSLLRLKHSLDEQQKMARQREDFVSRMTHDLRTPLVASDRMLNLFQQEIFCKISPEMKQAIAVMIRSNHNLTQMVNNLLEVYRIEAGKKTLNSEICNLPEMLTEVVEELNPIANDKGLTLKVDTSGLENLSEKKEGVVTGDRLELRRVFSNLIGNAIKFTDTGGIETRIFESAQNNDQNLVTIEIEDTGYGIAAEDQATIFERFRQGRNKRAGSGLGLHLSRLIVEAHGGAIEVFSEVGKGSVFTLRLPKQSQLSN